MLLRYYHGFYLCKLAEMLDFEVAILISKSQLNDRINALELEFDIKRFFEESKA